MNASEHLVRWGHGNRELLAIALVSLAGLALEIGLTRLFSVLFFPPTVFGILSLAILGIGLGAALVTWRSRWRDLDLAPRYLGFGAACVGGITVVSTIPVLQLALFGLVVVPFLFIGMVLTTLFSLRPQRSAQLYLADLVGAGLGALLAVPLLNWLGGLNGLLAVAVLLALAGWVLSTRPLMRIPLTLLGLSFVLLASNLLFTWLAVDMSRLPTEKPIADSLASSTGAVVDTRWDAFARTDLVDPGNGGPYRLYMDGAAGSIMPPAVDNDLLWEDIGFFPFATEQPQRVFLIGPGGGLDVWFALQSGAQEIVGVEVNAASVDLVADQAAYNGGLYGRSQVKMMVDDGRSVLQQDDVQYDLIFFSQLVTLAAERNGYALVENGVYTVEAFGEFLDHLTPRGQIGIKLYDEPTLTRALATALAALRRGGLTASDQEGLQHIIALLDGDAQPPIPLLIISKKPLSRDDSLSLGAVARQVGFTPLFLPGVVARPPLDGVAAGEISFGDLIADAANDLTPTTDNRPFFFQFERGIPQTLQTVLWGAGVVLVLGFLLVAEHQRRASDGRWAALGPLYFTGLGLGFILVEIGVIQETRLLLGHPTTATTVVLATLLISGGLGSGLGGRLLRNKEGLSTGSLIAVIVILALWMITWPWAQDLIVVERLSTRVLVAIAMLLPLGVAMGVPFPQGLKAAAIQSQGQVSLAWAVNGVMSVIGSVLAVALAIEFGYATVLLAGGMAYGIALIAALLEPS